MTAESVLSVLSAIAGVLFSALVMYVVMPKIDNACELPMPPLPSYWLGHAWKFLDIKRLLRTNLDWFRELGEVYQIWIVHRQVVVTANPEDVACILGKPALFARPPAQTAVFNDLQPDSFQTMPRELHRVHRKRLRDALSPVAVSRFADTLSRATKALVHRLSEKVGKPVDFAPEVADTTFTVLLEAVLGSKTEADQRRRFAKASHALLREILVEYFMYPLRRIFALTGVRRRLFRKHRAVLSFSDELLRARENETPADRASRPSDVLDVIRELDPEDRRRQLSNTAMFAIAGFESSSEAIVWAIYEITGRPEVSVLIKAEVDEVLGDRTTSTYEDVQKLTYLRMVWKEILRLHPAAGFMLRVATKETVLPGSRITIPQGVQVGALIAGAQRNPRYVSRPDDFLPERWAKDSMKRVPASAFVPFSCGPERCPGQALADFEGVAILAALYQAFDVKLACDRSAVVGISDWTERARAPKPGAPAGDDSWSLPVMLTPRTQ